MLAIILVRFPLVTNMLFKEKLWVKTYTRSREDKILTENTKFLENLTWAGKS